ncbi:MAG: preprotein translocase subunit SecD [Acidobacteria bacterium]|jgi:preprotein translocase subunit SecD|nr:preprotein translocase subunit SecD [Acidobacteriota bacterium]
MRNRLLWRGLLIVALGALAAWAVYPPEEKIHLGLDLQGGIHLVLQVQTQDAVRSETEKDAEVLRREAADKGVTGVRSSRTSDTSFEVTGYSPADAGKVLKAANDYLAGGWSWREAGDRLVFEMEPANEKAIRDGAVNQALQTIRNRIDQFGVSEPVIARQGLDSERIVVQLPGVDDPERVKRLIKNTAFLEFRLCDYPYSGAGAGSREEVLQHYGGRLPEDIEVLPEDQRDRATGKTISQTFYAVQRRQVITGRDLKSASPSRDQFGQPVVQFMLSADGAVRFGEATGSNVGRGLAIVLDGHIVSAPRINSRITDSGIIEGNFSDQDVQDLVTTLRSGALPAGITYLEDRTVGPSLGQDSIEASLKAGLLSVICVVLSLVIVYRFSGFNALVGLALNVLLLFGALAYFGATLTLPGIAGVVLSVAMAVDANVLIFERIKEEMKLGKTVRSAIEAGFDNALSSILDSNITTLIAALFLFQFGTGPIRGFAVTLSIGILGTLFCGIFVSRWLFDLFYSSRPGAQRISI